MLTQLMKVSLQNQCKRSFLARQTTLCNVLLQSNRKASSENKNVDDENLDKPIKYSTSPASTWLAANRHRPNMNRHPEENDIDLILDRPLPEIVPAFKTMSNASSPTSI